MQNYELVKPLGEGFFGQVLLVRCKHDSRLYALKRMPKKPVIESKQVDHLLNEIKILRTLSHPNVVTFHHFFQDSAYVCLLLEHLQGGGLFGYLRAAKTLGKEQARLYCGQVVLALEYLHSNSVIYRDLKPQNLLFDSRGCIKLSDFGFAKVVPDRTFTLCGTPEYLAPEIILNVGHGRPVDWWTLGVLLYEFLAGIDPFADKDTLSIYENILKCRLKFPKQFDKNAKSLVKHLLVSDLSKRYGNTSQGSQAIREHRFFQGLDWNGLGEQTTLMPYQPQPEEQQAERVVLDKDQEIPPEEDPFMQLLR